MPSAQPITMITPAVTKPKIGFSIDSIVGDRFKCENSEQDLNDTTSENLPKLPTSPTDLHREYSHLMNRTQLPSPTHEKSLRLSESSDQDIQNNNSSRELKGSPPRSPSPQYHKGPIMIPTALMNRPMMLRPPHHQLPPYPDLPPGHPHFLQFQAAAALVHAQASQTGFSGGMPQHLPHLHNHNLPRESYPLYPWLLSRHGRIFPHRFPGSELNFFTKPPVEVNNEPLD